MELSIPTLGTIFDSWGTPLTTPAMSKFSLLDMEENPFGGSGTSASDIALALGLASLGSAVAAAALGSFVVLRERGQARLPWEEKKLKVHSPLTPSDWSRAFDDGTGRMKGGGQKAIGRVRLGGCSNSIRGEVWPFLLGLHDANSTSSEREEERRKRRERFEELRHLAKVITRKAVKEDEAKVEGERKERERRGKEKERERAEREKEEEKERRGTEAERTAAKESLEEEGVLVEKRSRGDEDDELDEFSDAIEVTSAPGLDTSTESFVDVSHEDTSEMPELTEEPLEQQSSVSRDSRSGREKEASSSSSSRETELESLPLLAGEPSGRSSSSSNDNEVMSVESEWVRLSSSIPTAYKACPQEGDSPLQNFLVWRRIMRLDAVRMNSQWVPFSTQTEFPEDEALRAVEEVEVKSHEHLSAAQRTHAARLVSVLEAYAVFDPEIGYCQGMTDLLSPFVALILDDSDAFWCFVRFMETARHNFRTDEVGIRKQLDLVAKILEICDPELYRHLSHLGAQDCIFVYRMVIVLLRRELSFSQTVSLWEVLWAEAAAAAFADSAAAAASSIGATMSCGRDTPFALAPARTDFFLFVIAAIVVSRRGEVLQCEGLDEVLRLCNSLAGELEVWELINKARSLVSLFSLSEGVEEPNAFR